MEDKTIGIFKPSSLNLKLVEEIQILNKPISISLSSKTLVKIAISLPLMLDTIGLSKLLIFRW